MALLPCPVVQNDMGSASAAAAAVAGAAALPVSQLLVATAALRAWLLVAWQMRRGSCIVIILRHTAQHVCIGFILALAANQGGSLALAALLYT